MTEEPDDQSLRRPMAEIAAPFVNLVIALGATHGALLE